MEEVLIMTQTTGRLFDDVARLFSDAAGVAEGARREAETILRTQVERLLRSMDVVTREEFEAVRQMAILAREENDRLKAQLDALEARLSAADPDRPQTS
jgi:BMFP domain-containing protein YqiC